MISFIAGVLLGGALGCVATALAVSVKNPTKVFEEEADPNILVVYKREYEELETYKKRI